MRVAQSFQESLDFQKKKTTVTTLCRRRAKISKQYVPLALNCNIPRTLLCLFSFAIPSLAMISPQLQIIHGGFSQGNKRRPTATVAVFPSYFSLWIYYAYAKYKDLLWQIQRSKWAKQTNSEGFPKETNGGPLLQLLLVQRETMRKEKEETGIATQQIYKASNIRYCFLLAIKYNFVVHSSPLNTLTKIQI